MKYLSLFSGIEAASVAWEPLGWAPVAFAEIEPFPCAVLKHHYPDVPNLGSVTDITDEQIAALGPIDVVIGGSPCQDLSIAGKRAGLDGERSNLFFEQMMIYDAARRLCGARWLIWENVPGAFSSNAGRDFAAVVGAMAGAEYPVPRNGWQTAGVALGPGGLVEWCVLDAQWCGVAQRRRRVFAVLDAGDWTDRPPVFLEQHSLSRDSAPCREKGKGFARSPTCRTFADNQESSVAATIQTTCNNYSRADGFNVVTQYGPEMAGTLTERHDSSPCADRGQNAVAFAENSRAELRLEGGDGQVTGALSTGGGKPGQGTPMIAQGVAIRGREGGGTAELSGDISNALRASQGGGDKPHVLSQTAVRRLTHVECCRLQQFPDDYLDLKYADAEEAHAAQILHTLWKEVGAKGVAAQEADFPQNGQSNVCEKRRVAASLFTPQVLLAGVYVGWIHWSQARESAKRQNIAHVGKAGWTDGLVRGLRKAGEIGCSPYQRESFGQLARELGISLPKLPLEATQARKVLRDSKLWPEAQRSWPLRYAFATEKEREKGRPLTPDGPRYKALGNSFAVPVVRWIGERIMEVSQ